MLIRHDGAILEKPADRDEAFAMISSLLGSDVRVCSVVVLKRGDQVRCFEEISEVQMRSPQEICDEDIQGYLDTCNYR